MSTDEPFVYDKAKYHWDSVEELGLPEEHAFHHTTFFLSWLIQNRLMSEWFESEGRDELAKYRAGEISINQLYEWWDACLFSDMLSDEGNAFARHYFDFENGAYLPDYCRYLQKDLPTELPARLGLGAVSERADVRDVLIYRGDGLHHDAVEVARVIRHHHAGAGRQLFPAAHLQPQAEDRHGQPCKSVRDATPPLESGAPRARAAWRTGASG